MNKKLKTIVWLSLGALVILSPIRLIAEERSYTSTQPPGTVVVTAITTKLVNNSKKYSVWLDTEAESTWKGGIGLKGIYHPVKAQWIGPGKKEESTDKDYAPTGRAYLYYTSKEKPGVGTPSDITGTQKLPFLNFTLPDQSEPLGIGPFNLQIDVKPVAIHYFSGNYYKFYNYTITINDA